LLDALSEEHRQRSAPTTISAMDVTGSYKLRSYLGIEDAEGVCARLTAELTKIPD